MNDFFSVVCVQLKENKHAVFDQWIKQCVYAQLSLLKVANLQLSSSSVSVVLKCLIQTADRISLRSDDNPVPLCPVERRPRIIFYQLWQ